MGSHKIQRAQRHTHDTVRNDSWTDILERNLAIGRTGSRSPPRSHANQLLQPWAGFWLGRDTHCDEHLVGTASGVMRIRAVRRLKEPARWVPEALQTMLFALWAPHLNLVVALVSEDRHTRSLLMPSREVAEQSTKRQRQEEIPREPSQPGCSVSSSTCAADTSMQIVDPQIPKLARQLSPSPAEREDSIHKRQRAA